MIVPLARLAVGLAGKSSKSSKATKAIPAGLSIVSTAKGILTPSDSDKTKTKKTSDNSPKSNQTTQTLDASKDEKKSVPLPCDSSKSKNSMDSVEKSSKSSIQEISNIGKILLEDNKKEEQDGEKSPTKNIARFKQQEQKDENRRKTFNYLVTSYLERMLGKQSKIEENLEDIKNKKEGGDNKESRFKKSATFVGRQTKEIGKKISEEKTGTLPMLAIFGMLAAVQSIIEWYEEASSEDGGIAGYLWRMVDGYVQSKFNGWGGLVLSALQTIGDIALWIGDKVLSLIFGDDWEVAKIFWSEQFRKISEWWTEVESYGISGWIYKQLYDKLKDNSFLKELLPNPETLKENLSIQKKTMEDSKLSDEFKKKRDKKVIDMKEARERGEKIDAEWIKKYDEENNFNNYSVNKTENNIKSDKTTVKEFNTENNKEITQIKKTISDENVIQDIKNGNIVSKIDGKITSISKVDKEGNSSIKIMNKDGNIIEINNIKNSDLKVGNTIKKGQVLSKFNSSSSISKSKVVNNSSSVESVKNNFDNSTLEENSSMSVNNKNLKVENNQSSTNVVSPIQKNINIKTEAKESDRKDNSDIIAKQNKINQDLAAQVARLSAETNTGTLLQTKVSVVP